MKKTALCAIALLVLIAGCQPDRGPQQTLLDSAADALENKDPQKFMACLDIQAYSVNQLKNLTKNDEVLNSLDKLGNTLGLGGLNNIIGSIVDITGTVEQEMNQGVATGPMMAQCRTSITPDCPWVPQSLKAAKIIEVGPDAAIASVTTPANITSWLSLRKEGNAWKIVGRAPLENLARRYASPPREQPADQPGQKNQTGNATKI